MKRAPHTRLTALATTALTLLTALALPTAAADPPPAPTPHTNAALRYWPAWSLLFPTHDHISSLRNATDNIAVDDWTITPEAARTLAIATEDDLADQPLIQDLIAATRHPVCDFALETSRGFNLLLPHLAPMRAGGRLLALDTRRLIDADQSLPAAERIAALLRLAEHSTQARIIICSTVGGDALELAAELTALMRRRGQLGDAERDIIAPAAANLDTTDPLRLRESYVAEYRNTIAWLRAKCATPEGRAQALDVFDSIESLGGRPALTAGKAGLMFAIAGAGGFEASIAPLEPLINDIDRAWPTDNASARFDEIKRNIESGAHGPLAPIVTPMFTSVHTRAHKARETLAALHALLEPGARPEAP